MLLPLVALLAIVCVAIVVAINFNVRKSPTQQPVPTRTTAARPVQTWATAAGEEFAGLSEAERCDLVFAVAALDDGDSRQLLARALDDPSEAVALAAAHALVRRGGLATLNGYLAALPSERARALRFLVEILD